jgi:hypothetical protein
VIVYSHAIAKRYQNHSVAFEHMTFHQKPVENSLHVPHACGDEPMLGAWIGMGSFWKEHPDPNVAPCMGSVD